MSIKEHPFFQCLDLAERYEKPSGRWGVGVASLGLGKRQFYKALSEAHPFVFDRKVTSEKRLLGRENANLETLVEDFSLPFKNSLYLLTDAPTMMSNDGSETIITTTHGYLISEIDPEKFLVSTVATAQFEGHTLPMIDTFQLDLTEMQKLDWLNIPDNSVHMHHVKEISCVMELTSAISVKRIGIERMKTFSVKSRGVNSMGYTSIKMDNLIHIADKVDYEYTKSQVASSGFLSVTGGATGELFTKKMKAG